MAPPLLPRPFRSLALNWIHTDPPSVDWKTPAGVATSTRLGLAGSRATASICVEGSESVMGVQVWPASYVIQRPEPRAPTNSLSTDGGSSAIVVILPTP